MYKVTIYFWGYLVPIFSKNFWKTVIFEHQNSHFLDIFQTLINFWDQISKKVNRNFYATKFVKILQKTVCKNLENCRRRLSLSVNNLFENPCRPTLKFRDGPKPIMPILVKMTNFMVKGWWNYIFFMKLAWNYHFGNKKHEKHHFLPIYSLNGFCLKRLLCF